MKKILISLIALPVLSATAASANNINIFNITNCAYTVYLNSTAGPVSVAPMQSLTVNSGSIDATGAKVSWTGDPASIYAEMVSPTYGNSSTQGIYPPCIAGSGPYQISWAQSSASANATLIIFQ